jgi:serine/threonine-protein kinase
VSINPGDLLNNRYRVIKQLGQGGFGAVYEVEDQNSKSRCALKENLDLWDEARRQFKREAMMLATLRHPSLPRVTDYFSISPDSQYMVMNFVEGYDLETVIERVNKPLDEKKVLTWIDQICDALSYLHSQNPPIIHRDVKPGNIKITPSGVAMLVDFGIAKIFKPDIRTTLGARGVSPGYSPVEQYGHGTTDERADIYAVGATLYTLLTARKPPESIARVTGETLQPMHELNPTLSQHVELAIVRAMEILAADRYSSIAEFREALKAPPVRVKKTASPVAQQAGQAPALRMERSTRPLSTQASPKYPNPDLITKELTPSHRTAARIEWVTIPGGEFLCGEDKQKVILPSYQIARFPVTNQQYQHFLEANPHRPAPAYWKGRNYPVGKARHPVVGVSLYDALAFSEWLNCRLPSQDEWEKAARGSDGRTYPWGEGWEVGRYCNNWDATIGGTTAVERYAEGVSPYGVWDMIGNVWEWTTSEYQGPHMHILRGGSYRQFSRFAMRVTGRDWLTLEDVRDDLGFRCARSI